MPATTSSTASGSPSGDTIAEYHLTGGPRWYRDRIRTFGPLVALIVPGAIGVAAFAALSLSDAGWSGPVGLLGGYFAAPTLLAVGAPFADRGLYPIAVVAAVAMWLLIGLLASRRATRHPFATWSDWWRHYAWMLLGVWVGVVVALVFATVTVGGGVLDL